MDMNTQYEIKVLESLLRDADKPQVKDGLLSTVFNVVLFALLAITFLMTANSNIPLKFGLIGMAVLGFFAGVIFLQKQHQVRSKVSVNFYDRNKIESRLNEIKT
jgi:mannose/fructose/N-acetylgalactosamine-specific phosphotransferase system component IIC